MSSKSRSADAVLADFLISAFSLQEFKTFLRNHIEEGDEVVDALNVQARGLAWWAEELVRAADRVGLLDATFWAEWKVERPLRSDEISAIEAIGPKLRRRRETISLLTKTYSLSELKRFFTFSPVRSRLVDQVGSQPEIVASIAGLRQRGVLNAVFWEELIEVRRNRKSEILRSRDWDGRADLVEMHGEVVQARAGATGAALEKIVNSLALFNDPAVFRQDLEQREARVVRIDVDGRGEGTGWLVGPDLVLTANHVLDKAQGDAARIQVRTGHQIRFGQGGNLLIQKGVSSGLADKPFLAGSRPGSVSDEFSDRGVAPKADGSLLLDFALLRTAKALGMEEVNGVARGWFQLPLGRLEYQEAEGLYVLGHPQLQGDSEAGPLKFTIGLPSGVRLVPNEIRLRYQMNTEGGNSGSPVLNQEFEPVALHHAGSGTRLNGDAGFNQGIPLHAIVDALREQLAPDVFKELTP
jgi:hypothetical protein